MPFTPRAGPYGIRLMVHRTARLRGSLPVQPHRRFDGCSARRAWLSPALLAERVLSSNRGHSTLEIGAPPRPEGRGVPRRENSMNRAG